MRPQHITFTIDSRLEDVSLLAEQVKVLCLSAKLSRVESHQVELCIVEAVNNVIRHAYHNDPGHAVEVAVTIRADEIMFEISDTGTAADPEIMHADHRSALEPEDGNLSQVQVSGRGIAIIQALMDSFNY